MTEYEIKSIYKKIEELSFPEIQNLIDREFSSSYASGTAIGAGFGSLIGASVFNTISKWDETNKPTQIQLELEKSCRNSWDLNINQIRNLIQNNPKTSKGIMDIVLLLAPAIAQQYTGISGMAIVGTLTIICKQNLGL